jgi:ABC-type transport system involved in multi-copper enzyme maturation permease subunit
MRWTIFRALFRKEWRQLVASRAAVLTGAILPFMMLGLIPLLLAGLPGAGRRPSRPIPEGVPVGMVAELAAEPRHLAGALMPVLVSLVGLVLPIMLATHLVIAERERRTLELVVAWPVRLGEVLLAKLAATCALAALMTLPLLALDAVVLLALSAASVEQLVGLPLVLAAAVLHSSASSIAISLASKDFRTANNVGGFFVAPMILVAVTVTILVSGGVARALALSFVFLVVALGIARHVTRRASFERLLE